MLSLSSIVLITIWISLCVVVIGGWAFKTLDDDVIPEWDDVDFPAENENEQGNLL